MRVHWCVDMQSLSVIRLALGKQLHFFKGGVGSTVSEGSQGWQATTAGTVGMSCIAKIRLTVAMETVCRGSEGVGQESSLIGRCELHAYLFN